MRACLVGIEVGDHSELSFVLSTLWAHSCKVSDSLDRLHFTVGTHRRWREPDLEESLVGGVDVRHQVHPAPVAYPARVGRSLGRPGRLTTWSKERGENYKNLVWKCRAIEQ